jgi:hypothetical protein
LHFNCCLTTEYNETTAYFNGNFDTDNQIYVPLPKCTANFRTHCILTHCGPVTQICVEALQPCRTGDANLRFQHALGFHVQYTLTF